jgi:hypothetical protein
VRVDDAGLFAAGLAESNQFHVVFSSGIYERERF